MTKYKVLYHMPGRQSGWRYVVLTNSTDHVRIHVPENEVDRYPVGSEFMMSWERVSDD